MACNIAVIGHSDSIEYFRALGCRTYETKEGELTEEQFLEVVGCKYRIILVTEEVFHKYEKLIRQRTQRVFPVVSMIPDIRGAEWKDGSPVPGTSHSRNSAARSSGRSDRIYRHRVKSDVISTQSIRRRECQWELEG